MVALYLTLILIGWFNIYAAIYNEEHRSIFDLSQNYGRQLIWIVTSLALALFILVVDAKFYNAFSFIIYLAMLLVLVAVLFLGREISGAKAWFQVDHSPFSRPNSLKWQRLWLWQDILAPWIST